jgi:hypothetical protein
MGATVLALCPCAPGSGSFPSPPLPLLQIRNQGPGQLPVRQEWGGMGVPEGQKETLESQVCLLS